MANKRPNLSTRIVRVKSRGGVCRIDQFINIQGVSVHIVSVVKRKSAVGSHMKSVKADRKSVV